MKADRPVAAAIALSAIWWSALPANQAPTQADLQETVKMYCAAWNETRPGARQKMLEETVTADVTYTDPNGHSANREALMERISAFQQKRPGHKIVETSMVELHHGFARFTWAMTSPDGKIVMDGVDFVDVAPDGRLKRIVGFFGPIKPLK